jgi:phage repressor protein C with HTH and peptisase S24 domain
MENARAELDRLISRGHHGYAAISRLLGIRVTSSSSSSVARRASLTMRTEGSWQVSSVSTNRFWEAQPTLCTTSRIEIPILDVEASAGFGAVAASENAQTRFGFDERWLRSLTSAKSASLSIVRVLGDSMEPTLSEGDEVLVDASDHASRLRDGIYVLRADDALVVKRVAIRPGGTQITIASDNPAYPTWRDMDRSEVHVVGRVIWFGRAL